MWNIRKIIKKGDYLYAVVPEHPNANKHGYVLEHRVVVENSLGRLLLFDEDVHHIDGNKHNNSLENLDVIKHGEHQKMHGISRFPNGRSITKLVCRNCKKEFNRFTNLIHKENKDNFCSRKCNGLYNGFAGVLALPSKHEEHNG